MYAWVGVSGRGLLVAFDLVDGVPYGQDAPGVRAALAIALGWYLDVSISLRTSPTGTSTLRRASVGSAKTGARYVPKPSFTRTLNAVRGGSQSTPRLHGVVAHVRTFTGGYKPRASTRQKAPARLRATMQSNQTFVRAYLKGSGNFALMKTHFSKHSALADVLAAL